MCTCIQLHASCCLALFWIRLVLRFQWRAAERFTDTRVKRKRAPPFADVNAYTLSKWPYDQICVDDARLVYKVWLVNKVFKALGASRRLQHRICCCTPPRAMLVTVKDPNGDKEPLVSTTKNSKVNNLRSPLAQELHDIVKHILIHPSHWITFRIRDLRFVGKVVDKVLVCEKWNWLRKESSMIIF